MKNHYLKNGLLAVIMALFATFSLYAQNITVKGTVVDEGNEPLIGVNIRIQGSEFGTTTDIDGNFLFENIAPNAILNVSYIGMKSVSIPVKGRNFIEIVLKEDSESLAEVVIVGFGVQKKVNVTGAVSAVDAKALKSRPVQNVSQALQGVIPGLNFSQTNAGGTLNSEMSINIRGAGTIGAGSNSSPLILIDGIEGNINSINPNDIENISVLKDAASASIYGSRAAFGVILVTTKSGKKGRTNINYTGNIRLADANQVPKMLDAYRFAQFFNEAAKNSGQGAIFSKEALTEIDEYMKWQQGKLDKKPHDGTFAGQNGKWLMYGGARANTDWFKEMYKSWVPSQEHNVSINGGSEKQTFAVSGNFLDSKGLIRHGEDSFQRYTISGKIGVQLASWARLDYSSRWIREEYKRPSYMTGLFFHNIARRWPTNPVYDPNGHYMEGNEILQMEDGGIDKNQKDHLFQQFNLVLEPIKDWFIHGEFNYKTINNYNHWDVLPIYGYDVNNQPFAAPWQGGDSGQSKVSESSWKQNYWTTNIFTDYTKAIEEHYFKVMVGTNIELMKTRNLGGEKKDLITPLVSTINTATNDTPSFWGGYGHWSSVGFFGRLNYNYKEKYLLEANIRRDGTSRFVGDKTWGTFPSFSLGWNIAREEFFGNLANHISTLKLRGSWGELGNMNTNNWYPFFLSMPIGVGNGSWLVNNKKPNTSWAPGIVSSLMTWETIRSWNIGLDWNALKGRFSGTFDYFKRETKDMIGPAPELSSLLGTGVPKVNNADMESHGWELELNWRDRIGEFNYGVKFILSDDQQKVTRYPNESYNLNSWYNGRKTGEIWGYTTEGIAKSNDEMNAHLEKNRPSWGSNWAAGDIMYKDLNGDGIVNNGKNTLEDHGDLSIIGNASPRFKYGLTLDAEWRGIDFRAFFQGVGKRDYVLGGPYFWGATGGMWQSVGFEEHWDFFRPEGDELGANLNSYYPRPLFADGGKNQQTQTRYLQDASYLRLKNIQLGYTLPSSLTKKAGMQSVRLYVSGDNLLTFSDITGIFDPELLGGDWGPGKLYPLSKVVSFGINVNF